MYLSDRDLRWAIEKGQLIVSWDEAANPNLDLDIGPTSIDLHLDRVEEAQSWDVAKLEAERRRSAGDPFLRLGKFKHAEFAPGYLTAPPRYRADDQDTLVSRRGDEIIVRPNGFLLWQTKEKIGTPKVNAQHICFIDGKSTRARAGIVVHLTAPTIHASWSGNVVLEIVNLGPFTFSLEENDVIAQITVATISSLYSQDS